MALTDTPPTAANTRGEVTLPLPLLRRWIGGAATVTPGKRDGKDQLRVVRIEPGTDGGTVAVGTDAFSLAALMVGEAMTGAAFLVDSVGIVAALKAAGKPKGDRRTATLAGDGSSWSLTLSDGQTFGGTVSGVGAPAWRSLFPTGPGVFEAASFGVVTFAKVADVLATINDGATIRWQQLSATRPACGFVVGGDGITGKLLFMPVRASEGVEPPTL